MSPAASPRTARRIACSFSRPGATLARARTDAKGARRARAGRLGGRLYAIGGRDGSVQIAVPEIYDPNSGGWSDLPACRSLGTMSPVTSTATVCVAGGRTPESSGAIDCFDPRPRPGNGARRFRRHSGAAAAALDRLTVVAGGEPAGETSIVGVVQWSRRGEWRTTPMLLPRHGTAFAVFRGRLWLCGGATSAGFHAVAQCTSIAAGRDAAATWAAPISFLR